MGSCGAVFYSRIKKNVKNTLILKATVLNCVGLRFGECRAYFEVFYMQKNIHINLSYCLEVIDLPWP